MGYWKEQQLLQQEDPFFDVSDRLVGVSMFKNELIIEHINNYGNSGYCSYSGRYEKTLPLKTIVEYIHEIIMTYFDHPDNAGVGWDSHEDDLEDTGWTKWHGGWLLPDNRKIYDDISLLLFENGFEFTDDELEMDIISAFPDVVLVQQDPYGLTPDETLSLDWKYINESVVENSKVGKSFDEIAKEEHIRLYNILSKIQTVSCQMFLYNNLDLFRCVNYKDRLEKVEYTNLTSPPIQYTDDLRMSRKGESYFYGALDKNTATEESLGNKNPFTYVGYFHSLHPLTILDLRRVKERLSIFNQPEGQYHTLLFLSNFCNDISKPNSERNTEAYIPTQFITYYFKNVLKHYRQDGKHSIDGIAYTSSRTGGTDVVLFFDNTESAKHLRLCEYDEYHDGDFHSNHKFP